MRACGLLISSPVESNLVSRGAYRVESVCYYYFYRVDSRQQGQESAADGSTRAAADPSMRGLDENQRSQESRQRILCLSAGGYRGMEASRGGAIIRR